MCNARCGKVVVAETMHLLLQAAKPAAPSQLVARTFGTTQRAYTDFSLFQTVFIHLTYLILLYLILLDSTCLISCLISCMWTIWARKAASPETPLMHYTATQQASLKWLQVFSHRQAMAGHGRPKNCQDDSAEARRQVLSTTESSMSMWSTP